MQNVTDRQDFDAWIDGLLQRYRTKRALAEAAGLSESAFWRQIRDTGSLGVPPLLKLALATGEPASEILRRAKKGELADLIELCYGAPREVRPAVRDVLVLLEQLPEWAAQMTARTLTALRNELPSEATPGNAPRAEKPATTRTRATRAVPKK